LRSYRPALAVEVVEQPGDAPVSLVLPELAGGHRRLDGHEGADRALVLDVLVQQGEGVGAGQV
jgi:hypothetical protein